MKTFRELRETFTWSKGTDEPSAKKPRRKKSDPIDMKGKTCINCKKGKYIETSIHDDIGGVQHCSHCNHQTDRYVKV